MKAETWNNNDGGAICFLTKHFHDLIANIYELFRRGRQTWIKKCVHAPHVELFTVCSGMPRLAPPAPEMCSFECWWFHSLPCLIFNVKFVHFDNERNPHIKFSSFFSSDMCWQTMFCVHIAQISTIHSSDLIGFGVQRFVSIAWLWKRFQQCRRST